MLRLFRWKPVVAVTGFDAEIREGPMVRHSLMATWHGYCWSDSLSQVVPTTAANWHLRSIGRSCFMPVPHFLEWLQIVSFSFLGLVDLTYCIFMLDRRSIRLSTN